MIKNILAGIGILALVIFAVLAVVMFVVIPKALKTDPFEVKPDVGYSRDGALVSVTITEGDINAKLADNPQIARSIGQSVGGAGPFPQVKTQNLRVKLERDRLTAAIDADIWGDGTLVTGTLSGKVFVSNNKPAVELDRITMGVMPFPPPLLARANTELNKRLQGLDFNVPFTLREIRVEPGQLTVTGTVDFKRLPMPGAGGT